MIDQDTPESEAVDTLALVDETPHAFGHWRPGEPLVAEFEDTLDRNRTRMEQRAFVDALANAAERFGFRLKVRAGLAAMRRYFAKTAVSESSIDDRLADLEMTITAMVDSQSNKPTDSRADKALARVMVRAGR